MQNTILIVEDDDGLRSALKKILVTNNFKVVEASDGAEALEAVEKYFPDLVVLDFGLPKVPGETVCVKIKKNHPEIIVIALTEKTKSSDVVHGLQIGADDYISKPFVAEELIARIDAKFKTTTNSQVQHRSKESEVEEAELGKIILRESVALVIIRLTLTEVLFGFFLLLLSIFYENISSYLNNTDLSILYFIVLTGVFLINSGVVALIALRWAAEHTEISKEGVVKHSGILHKKEQKYACNFVEGATLNQSFLGLLLNYGTIELYDPALKEQVYLLNIANPKENSEKIQKLVSKKVNKPIPFVA